MRQRSVHNTCWRLEVVQGVAPTKSVVSSQVKGSRYVPRALPGIEEGEIDVRLAFEGAEGDVDEPGEGAAFWCLFLRAVRPAASPMMSASAARTIASPCERVSMSCIA